MPENDEVHHLQMVLIIPEHPNEIHILRVLNTLYQNMLTSWWRLYINTHRVFIFHVYVYVDIHVHVLHVLYV